MLEMISCAGSVVDLNQNMCIYLQSIKSAIFQFSMQNHKTFHDFTYAYLQVMLIEILG